MTDDDRLRDLFRAADRKQRAQAPPFAGLLRRAPRPRPAPLALLGAAAAILLAGALVFSLRRTPAVPAAPDPFTSSARWDGPTDFLLETPGIELFRSTPEIGAPPPLQDGSSEPGKGTRT